MDAVPDEDLVLPRGLARTIAYARDARGCSPAREFLRELPASDRRRLGVLFEVMAARGHIASSRHFRKELGAIWGFKTSSGVRIAAFMGVSGT